ncbi:MAG: hypothetical protein Q9212_006822, partial [Teloschistes hypoglaucus]
MSSKSKSKGPKKPHPSHPEKGARIAQPNRLKIAVGIVQTYCLIGLSVLATHLLQSCISPVYGSLAANQYHDHLIISAIVVVGLTHRWWNDSSRSWAQILAVLLLSVPSAVFYLVRFSRQLGPRFGPLVTGLVSTFPLTLISVIAACKRRNQNASSSSVNGQWTMYEIITSTSPALLASITRHWFSDILQQWMRKYISNSNLLSYYLLALFQAFLFPSKYLLFAALPVLHTVFYTAYIPFPYSDHILNATLHDHGYSLVARQESVTGYISVLDNVKDGFRVMRCDHSLLGGEWHPQPGKKSGLREPIYAIFVMLEAVRLVESASAAAADDSITREGGAGQENALVIGLGIGTTPSALIAHGIDTTILEIDPVVHAFATKYFNLPTNHTAIIQDATLWVSNPTKNPTKYNYIIHDVFTGGAEPIDLFTADFLTALKTHLKTNGVIAINYAGDLNLPTAARV